MGWVGGVGLFGVWLCGLVNGLYDFCLNSITVVGFGWVGGCFGFVICGLVLVLLVCGLGVCCFAFGFDVVGCFSWWVVIWVGV